MAHAAAETISISSKASPTVERRLLLLSLQLNLESITLTLCGQLSAAATGSVWADRHAWAGVAEADEKMDELSSAHVA